MSLLEEKRRRPVRVPCPSLRGRLGGIAKLCRWDGCVLGEDTDSVLAMLPKWFSCKLIKRSAGGERRDIGLSTRVSFSNGKPVERFDPEGPKNPKGERRSVGRKRQLG